MAEPKPITEHLVDMLRERSARGQAKYGTTIDRGDLSRAEWLQHLLEELLDAAQYVEAAKRQADALPTAVLTNPYTGKPRDYRDVESDPAGVLIVEPGAPLKAAPPAAAVSASGHFEVLRELSATLIGRSQERHAAIEWALERIEAQPAGAVPDVGWFRALREEWLAAPDSRDFPTYIRDAMLKTHPAPLAVPAGWVAVPRRLTAENGGKFEFLGATFDGYRVPWGAVKAVHKAIVAWAEKRAAAEREGVSDEA